MLFNQTNIGNLSVKNSFLKSATWEKRATENGHMTEYLYNHYEELAKGDVGTIILSYAHVLENEKPNPGMLGIYDDSFIKTYSRLTETVHKYGSKIIAQLVYGGTMTKYNVEGRDILSPSGIPMTEGFPSGRLFNEDDVNLLIDAFKKAAIRAKSAGFDGVQLHSAHGYFFSQLLSPVYNKRTDEYGQNKGLLLSKIYSAVREVVGKDYPIWIKINCKDFLPNGNSVEDVIKVCQDLEKLGLDAIEVSGGHGVVASSTFAKKGIFKVEDEGIFEKETIQIANSIDIPVIMVGGVRSLEYMEKISNTSKVKLFALARPLISERDLIKKWKDNPTLKARCISCGKCFGLINEKEYTCILDR